MKGVLNGLSWTVARACVLAAALCLSATAAQAQVAGLRPATQGDERGRVMRPPLELTLSAPVTTVLCRGDALGLELEVRNVSDTLFGFDKSALWKNFSYSCELPDGSGQGGGSGTSCSHCKRDMFALAPGLVLRDRHEFSLKGEFFRRPGEYEILTAAWIPHGGQDLYLPSNRLKFEIMDCGQIESEEK